MAKMTWVIFMAASATRVSKIPTESHLKRSLDAQENVWAFFTTAIVLRDRLGSGLPPGPVSEFLPFWLTFFAANIELAMNATIKVIRRTMG